MEPHQLEDNYTTANPELDGTKGEVSENITTDISQSEVVPSTNGQIQNEEMSSYTIDISQSEVPSKSMTSFRQPRKHHRYLLIDEITIDKFRIISEAGRNYYKVVFGIPTVARTQNQNYLIQTLHSLFNNSNSLQELNMLVIIFVADIETDRCQDVADLVMHNHYSSFRRGSIEIVCPHPTLYPRLDNLPSTLGDSEDRIKWRSKQNIDFGFLMWYASDKGEYYIQLEDDIIAAKDYAYHIDQHIDKVKDDFWFLIHFSVLGFIGKLMRTSDLLSFASYLLLFYSNQPCDWLVYDYGRSLVCYSGLDYEGCNSHLNNICILYTPSLFQHIGLVSSLPGKTMDAKDPYFEEPLSFEKPTYSNPPAKINSTLSIHSLYTADMLYEGKGYFWSEEIVKGDSIVVEFVQPQKLIGINIQSGNQHYPQDILQDGVVQFKTQSNSDYEHWCGFIEGKANCTSTTPKQIHALRIIVLEPQTHWLLITHFECLL